MIAILGAMDEEIKDLLENLEEKKEKIISTITFYDGIISGKKVVIASSGIGMVSSSMVTTLLCYEYNPKYLIFSGVAGALSKELSPCDVVVSDRLIEYEFDATSFGYKIGEIPRLENSFFKSSENLINILKNITFEDINIKYGNILSADKFVDNRDKKIKLGNDFDAFAVDMESAAFAQVCEQFKKEFLVIRSISDSVNNNSVLEYSKFLNIAVKNNKEIILKLLENL